MTPEVFKGDYESEHFADQELRYDGHTWRMHDWATDETMPLPEHRARGWLLRNHYYNVVARFWPGEAERYIAQEEARKARMHRDIADADARLDAWEAHRQAHLCACGGCLGLSPAPGEFCDACGGSNCQHRPNPKDNRCLRYETWEGLKP